MITKQKLKWVAGSFICAGALLSAPAGNASVFYHVDVNTAVLMGNAGAPFSLDFQLNDGSGAGDGNNMATISNFTFGGGNASGSSSLLGSAVGDLSAGVVLTDGMPFNEFFQSFTPGSTLGFDLVLTTNPEPGSTPDTFSFAILDNSLMNIPTTGVGDSFFSVNIGVAGLVAQTGASLNPVGVTVTAVPEPSTTAFIAMGLTVMLLRASRALRKA